jgi:hypothetical protein
MRDDRAARRRDGPPRRCWTLRMSRKTTSAASPRTSVGCRRAPIRKRRPPGSVPGRRPTRPNAILAMVQSTYGHVPGPGPGAPERKRWLQCLRRLAGTCRMRPRQPSPRRRRRSPSCRHAPSRGLDASPGIRSGTAGPTKPESKVRLRRSDATWSSSDALVQQPGAWIRRARPAKLCRPWARHGLSV